MARSKSPNGSKRKTESVVNPAAIAPLVAAEAGRTAPLKADGAREGAKLEVVKTDSRASTVPVDLEDEIRRRAYELSQQRGFASGYETHDWLAAENEVLQRYRQHSA